MKDNRKIFFTSLLSALLIFSNVIVNKMTVVGNLPLPCSIFVYSFTFLCVAIITDLYGAKEAIKSVVSAIICQIIILVLGTIVINLPNQVDTLMEANSLQLILAPKITNGIFYPNIILSIGTIIGFLISQLVNIGLYSFSKKYTYKVVSSALSILISFILDTVIFTIFKSIGLTVNNIGLTIVNQFVVGVVITAISVVLLCIFTIQKKDKSGKKINKIKTDI